VSALVMVALLGSVGLVTVTSGTVEGSRARAVAELGALATLNWGAGVGSEVVIVNGGGVVAMEADALGSTVEVWFGRAKARGRAVLVD
jgi:hypothetical protein